MPTDRGNVFPRFNRKSKIENRKFPAGFTLLEILLATAILTLIVIVLAALSSAASRLWTATEAQNQRRTTGRALLQFIARDFEMATIPNLYPSFTNSTNSANLQFAVSLPATMPAEVLNPHAAFWQAPVAADRSRGDLAEIGYFVRWDTTSQPGTAKAQLCRFFVDPADTTNFQIYTRKADGTPADWFATTNISRIAPATAANDYRGWFADNVIALWIRCLDRDGNPIVKTAEGVNLNGGYGFDSRQGYLNPTTGFRWPAPGLPSSVEIALVTVDARTAKRIKTPLTASPNSPDNFGKKSDVAGSVAYFVANLPAEIKPGVQVFTTRIYLKN